LYVIQNNYKCDSPNNPHIHAFTQVDNFSSLLIKMYDEDANLAMLVEHMIEKMQLIASIHG
jgi:hypothetical protein